MYKSLHPHFVVLAILLVLPLVVAACGGSTGASTPSSGGVTNVNVTLTEYSIKSDVTNFSAGTKYHFIIKNTGAVKHELLILPNASTDSSQALLWVKSDQLGPGATATADYTFTTAGSFQFGCLLPGHYDEGMHTAITVK